MSTKKEQRHVLYGFHGHRCVTRTQAEDASHQELIHPYQLLPKSCSKGRVTVVDVAHGGIKPDSGMRVWATKCNSDGLLLEKLWQSAQHRNIRLGKKTLKFDQRSNRCGMLDFRYTIRLFHPGIARCNCSVEAIKMIQRSTLTGRISTGITSSI